MNWMHERKLSCRLFSDLEPSVDKHSIDLLPANAKKRTKAAARVSCQFVALSSVAAWGHCQSG
jgi:hypothetical protein